MNKKLLYSLIVVGAVCQLGMARPPDTEKTGFFQPTPMYKHNREHVLQFPLHPDYPPQFQNWVSETSRTWCTSDGVKDQYNAAGLALDSFCNDYQQSLLPGTGPLMGLPSQNLSPREIINTPALYFPLCPLALTGNFQVPSDILKLGWNFTSSGQEYIYTGCWGTDDLVAVAATGTDLLANDAYLMNSASDRHEDLVDNVSPFLGAEFDPVNMAFSTMDQVDLEYLPMSVTIGLFNVDEVAIALDQLNASPQPGIPMPRIPVGVDIAILSVDNQQQGYVSFIPNRGFNSERACVKDAFAASCPTCPDPYAPGVDYNVDCDPCVKTSDMVRSLNNCNYQTNYTQQDVISRVPLEGTDHPVYIGTMFNLEGLFNWYDYAKYSPKKADRISGANLVVVNRGKIDCFPDDHSIDFRNPYLKSADGDIDTNHGSDINNTHGIDVYTSTGSNSTPHDINENIMPDEVGADGCGYLTFYATNLGQTSLGTDIEVSPYVIPGTNPPEVLKIPVGPNPHAYALGDFNGDGYPFDILVANTGVINEDGQTNGSLTAVYCAPPTQSYTRPEYPNSQGNDHNPLCPDGVLIVKDIPINNQTSGKHPWWVVGDIFKGFDLTEYDWQPANNICGPGAYCKGIRAPTSAAVTFIDSYELNKGDWALFLNAMEDESPPSKEYYFYDVNFDIVHMDISDESQGNVANPIAGSPKHVPPTPVRKLTSGYSAYPLAIAAGPFVGSDYANSDVAGLAGFLGTFVSNQFIASLVSRLRNPKLLSSPLWIALPGFASHMSLCPELMIGLNNSHQLMHYRQDQTFVPPGPATPPEPSRCSGSLSFSGDPMDAPDAVTAVYDISENPTEMRGWGPKFARQFFGNAQTERAMKTGDPSMYYFDTTDDRIVQDTQPDLSYDLAVINGAPWRLIEFDMFSGNDDPGNYWLPDADCNSGLFELTTLINDTSGYGDALDYQQIKRSYVGEDPETPHRCEQRWGGDMHLGNRGVAIDVAEAGQACCLLLETPEYAGNAIASTADIPQFCPGRTDMTCCVLQNIWPFYAGDTITVDYDPLDTNGTYEPNAPICQCGEEVATMISMSLGMASKNAAYWPAWSDVEAARIEFCACINDPTHPTCEGLEYPPVDVTDCEGFLPDHPDTHECCVAAEAKVGAGASFLAVVDQMRQDGCHEAFDDPSGFCNIVVQGDNNGNICCQQIIINGGTLNNVSMSQCDNVGKEIEDPCLEQLKSVGPSGLTDECRCEVFQDCPETELAGLNCPGSVTIDSDDWANPDERVLAMFASATVHFDPNESGAGGKSLKTIITSSPDPTQGADIKLVQTEGTVPSSMTFSSGTTEAGEEAESKVLTTKLLAQGSIAAEEPWSAELYYGKFDAGESGYESQKFVLQFEAAGEQYECVVPAFTASSGVGGGGGCLSLHHAHSGAISAAQIVYMFIMWMAIIPLGWLRRRVCVGCND